MRGVCLSFTACLQGIVLSIRNEDPPGTLATEHCPCHLQNLATRAHGASRAVSRRACGECSVDDDHDVGYVKHAFQASHSVVSHPMLKVTVVDGRVDQEKRSATREA